MIRVLLVDDHPVVRRGLRAMVDELPELSAVGEAGDGAEALRLLEALPGPERPDVVLMDLQMGAGMHGVEATRRINALPDPPAVLILTTYSTDADILAAVEAGATGYLLKDAPPQELVAAVRAASRGETVLAPPVAARLLGRVRAAVPPCRPGRPRSSNCSPRAWRTVRSPNASSSARPPSRPTWCTSTRSSAWTAAPPPSRPA